VARKKDVIQKETEPMHERPDGPDQVEEKKKYDSFAGEMGGGIF